MIIRRLLVVAAVVAGAATLQVSISPQHAHLMTPSEDLVVRCAADSPIIACHVRVGDQQHADLSRGRFSEVPGYVYEGDGLSAGHCGVILSASVLPAWGSRGLVRCRVLAAGSDWAYAVMSVYRYGYTKIQVTTRSRLVLAAPGTDVTHLLLTGEPLVRCELEHPQLGWKNLDNYPVCSNTADSLCYFGQGLIHRECGVNIRNITDRSNGFLWFHVETTPGLEQHFLQVVVIKPPEYVALETQIKRNVDSTITIEAWCTVYGSRPKANITWHLQNQVVINENTTFIPDERWVDLHETQSTTQKLTKTINKAEHGQELWCSASHEVLPVEISSNKTWIVAPAESTGVSAPCSPSPCRVDIRCLLLDGKPLCECVPGYFSSPKDRLCVQECGTNPDCPTNKTCKNTKCVDPCPEACGLGATCTTINHIPVCSCPLQPAVESAGSTVLFKDPEVLSNSSAQAGPDVSSCGPAALEEHRVRLLHLAELHKMHVQAEQAKVSVEKENAVAARARARVEEENVLTARARAKNAEEELEFQRELRRTKMRQVSELGGTSNQPPL